MRLQETGPADLTGDRLADLRTAVPGPASRSLARRLATVESRNITSLSDPGPIFWSAARGANVRDADGNTFIDLTAGFGVAHAGHANPDVASAIARQAATLAHGLGDVYPPDIKVALLEALADRAPGDLAVSILGSAGAEAVEAALKTARLRTGRGGVLAFMNGYHGLTYGALATTSRAAFRSPFADQLFTGVRFAQFPRAGRDDAGAALDAVARELREADRVGRPIGAVLIEPIQGRGGIVVPPPSFLAGLRTLCDGHTRVLIFDEVYTGFGRTGRWFACDHEDVVPDILVVGKALTGSVALSAAIGTPAVMDAWPPSAGEAIHTSTFLGNPIACAAALASIAAIESGGLVERAALLGERIRARTGVWVDRFPTVVEARGRGLLQGVELRTASRVSPSPARRGRASAPERRRQEAARPETPAPAAYVVDACLRRGVLVLAEGTDANVLALTPPAVITDAQLDAALDTIEDALAETHA